MAEQQLTRILFTSAGRRVELVQAFQRAAAQEGIPVWITGADLSETAPALYFCDEAVKLCPISEERYIPELIEICRERQVDLLIPTIDTDLLKLSESRESFEENGTRVLVSAPDKIRLCRDKRLTAVFFKSCGLYSPETADRLEDYKGVFPCFIKPLDGSSSINAYRVDEEKDLAAYAGMIGEGRYIIQPFIKGREYTIDIFCDFDGAPVYITPRERLAVRSGEVLKTRICQDEQMIQEAKEIIRHFHPVGTISLQLIREEQTGRDYFIEINPRFGGGAPLSIKAGADIPGAVLRMLTGKKTAFMPKAAENGKLYARFDDSICVTDRQKTIPAVRSGQEVSRFVKELVGNGVIDGVVFDLDDTLYSEYDYIKNGFHLAAQELTRLLEEQAGALQDDIPQMSAQDWYGYMLDAYHGGQRPIDAAFTKSGLKEEEAKRRVLLAYRNQQPTLFLYPWARELLSWLTSEGGIQKEHIGIITDGRPEGQRAKLSGLGLYDLAGEILVTDELGGPRFRKPCDIAFRIMQLRMNIPMERILYVGNNPAKDLKAPRVLGMKALFFDNPLCIHSF